MTYPDGTVVTRGYSDRNQLNQLTYAGTVVDTRMYDNGKRMTSSTYNNGVGEARTYKADNTLAAINFSGAAIGNLSYGWDANKNKTAETIGGTMSGYGFTIPGGGYDTEDRLVSYTRTDGALAQSWNLSPVGDWNSVTTNSVAQNRTHGPTHELTAINTAPILHDAKGSLTQNSSGHLYTWDFDNRLQGANTDGQPGDEVTYQWDALGRRILRADGATATVFIPSGQQTIADYTSGALPTSPTYNYVYATYIDEPILRHEPATSTFLYYHRNQQYSIVALTSSTATIIERYAYTAYGAPTITSSTGTVLPTSSISNRYTYTAREHDDALTLYHYRARMYDPNLGRFIGRDPIGYAGTYVLYGYTGAQPLNRLDPNGRKWISVCTGCPPTEVPDEEIDTPFELCAALGWHWFFGGKKEFTEGAEGLKADPWIQRDAQVEIAKLVGKVCSNGNSSGSKKVSIKPNPKTPCLIHTTNVPSYGMTMDMSYTSTISNCCCTVTVDVKYRWMDFADIHPKKYSFPDWYMTWIPASGEFWIDIQWQNRYTWTAPVNGGSCKVSSRGWPSFTK